VHHSPAVGRGSTSRWRTWPCRQLKAPDDEQFVPGQRPDAITLELWWIRLVAITYEAATTMLRTALSTIIRESNDYTFVLMNTSGQGIAEFHGGIPAFAALMRVLTRPLRDGSPAASLREVTLTSPTIPGSCPVTCPTSRW
jgi:hypothetical protein